MSLIHSIWTVLVFIVFIGIVAWAWSRRQRKSFDEAANLPFMDDPNDQRTLQEEKRHG